MLPELKGIPLPDSREAYDLVTAHGKKFDEAYILEKASVDATLNIPALDSEELTSFEKQLLHETSLLANKVAIQFRKSLELIDAVIKAEESAFTTVKEYQDSDLTEHNTNFIDDVQNSYQPKEVSRRIAQAEARYNEFYEKFKRPPTVYIPHWLYIILALVIFVGEIPLNALVFQIFGENQIMTWIMATIIGLSVPLIAHFIGIKFREHPNRIDLANLVKGIIALTVVVAALYGLSVMRQTYLGENKDALGLTDNLVASSFMFFWLNIAVLGAAIMISYMSHDAVPGYQNAEKELKLARKSATNLDRANRKIKTSSRYQKLGMTKDSKVNTIEASKKIIMLKGYYDMLLKEGQELERQCMQGFQHDVELYRRENLQKRPDKTKPKSFSQKPTFELQLTAMNEKLVN